MGEKEGGGKGKGALGKRRGGLRSRSRKKMVDLSEKKGGTRGVLHYRN